jgi:hypothetical protein
VLLLLYSPGRGVRFSTRCNIVAFWLPGYDDLSFYFLNVADFKGIRAGWHFQ